MGKITIDYEIVGLDELTNAIADVRKKADELEQAVHRLNEVELEFQLNSE